MWRLAYDDLNKSNLWSGPIQPLLDEYITALRTAHEKRLIAEGYVQTIRHRDGDVEVLPAGMQRSRDTGIDHPHKNFDLADREVRRAMALANLLGLTVKAKKALARAQDEPPEESDAFAIADELAQRRERRANA